MQTRGPMTSLERFSILIMGHSITACLQRDSVPRHAALLSRIITEVGSFSGRHAIYTGPEISCPLPADDLPFAVDLDSFREEACVHEPAAGDIVVVCAGKGEWGDFPDAPLVDVGLFYDDGGRLAFPFGRVEGSVAARIEQESLSVLRPLAVQLRDTPNAEIPLRLEFSA